MELGSFNSYFGTLLIDSNSETWTILLMECCIRVAGTILRDVHDIWRLWYLPQTLIESIKKLGYSAPLGFYEDYRKVPAV